MRLGAFRYLAPTRQAQPTDITRRNRRSHSAMHPMEALHSRSGTTSRPCSIGSTETLQASLRFRVPWPPAPSARRTSVCSLNMDCYSHSDGPREPSGGHRASPWGVRRRLGGPRGSESVGRTQAVVGLTDRRPPSTHTRPLTDPGLRWHVCVRQRTPPSVAAHVPVNGPRVR